MNKITDPHLCFVSMDSPLAWYYLDKDPYYLENFKDYDEPFTGEIAVDTQADKMVGYIYVGAEDSSNEGFIESLEVSKEYRNQGVGSKLLQDAINKLGAIDLLVDKTNETAIRLYLKNGFEILDWDDPDQFWMKLKDVE